MKRWIKCSKEDIEHILSETKPKNSDIIYEYDWRYVDEFDYEVDLKLTARFSQNLDALARYAEDDDTPFDQIAIEEIERWVHNISTVTLDNDLRRRLQSELQSDWAEGQSMFGPNGPYRTVGITFSI